MLLLANRHNWKILWSMSLQIKPIGPIPSETQTLGEQLLALTDTYWAVTSPRNNHPDPHGRANPAYLHRTGKCPYAGQVSFAILDNAVWERLLVTNLRYGAKQDSETANALMRDIIARVEIRKREIVRIIGTPDYAMWFDHSR